MGWQFGGVCYRCKQHLHIADVLIVSQAMLALHTLTSKLGKDSSASQPAWYSVHDNIVRRNIVIIALVALVCY